MGAAYLWVWLSIEGNLIGFINRDSVLYVNKLLIKDTFLIFAILDCEGVIAQCTSLFIQDICS